jgi:hypothetical protein
VDGFRVAQLEARFNSYGELFNRRVRTREEGDRRARASEDEAPRPDPRSGVVMGERLDRAAAEALFQGLASAGSPPAFDLESFSAYLGRQLAAIRSRTGCEQVQFRIVSEAGQAKLKAKPLTAAEPASDREDL